MTETEKHIEKEETKNNLQDFLRQYIKAAENYDLDDIEQAGELEDLLFDLGKKWVIIPE
jgi:hypothetical protein